MDDDLAAAAAFHDWIKNLGYKASLRPDGKIVIIQSRFGYDYDVHFRNSPTLKRLIMRCFFPSNTERSDMPGRYALANKINSSFNIGIFWVHGDADFACKFMLPFEERLTATLWGEFFGFCEDGVAGVIQEHADDFRPYMA